jgi:antitoxin component YwqK of YwqJK toxin-antitoxin module
MQNRKAYITGRAKRLCLVRRNLIMRKTLFLLAFVVLCAVANAQPEYKKEYNSSNTKISEGWMENGTRVKYWKFYTTGGKLKEEGHFTAGKRSGYWYFYNENGTKTAEGSFANDEKTNWWKFYVNGKKQSAVQYSHNQRNGYCFLYNNGDVYKCEKYKNDIKTGEWTDIGSFRRDNPDY